MAIALTEKLRADIGKYEHRIYTITDACETVTLSQGNFPGMNFITYSQFIPLSTVVSAGSTSYAIMVTPESSAGGFDISLSTELTVDLGLLKVWGW